MTGNIVRTFDDVKERIDAGDLEGLQDATATVDGVGSLIKPDAEYVRITSGGAGFWVDLPAAVDGKVLRLFCAATGCEVRSSVVTDDLNGVLIGATNEAALVASTEYLLVYNNGNWVMTGLTSSGAVEAPVVPDAV